MENKMLRKIENSSDFGTMDIRRALKDLSSNQIEDCVGRTVFCSLKDESGWYEIAFKVEKVKVEIDRDDLEIYEYIHVQTVSRQRAVDAPEEE